MLANVLAVVLGISSFTFYMAAFFYPEVHRRSDFLLSGLGMFYAVILWFCAGQMTPTVLLGQMTAVGLLMGLGWQTLTVRREKTPVYQQTPVVLTPEVVGNWARARLNQLRIAPDETIRPELQNRTLTAATSERLRQSLDPRRRPTYDYEFVEDGLLEVATNSLATQLTAESSDLLTAEAGAVVPPSAEAEVLLEILPEEATVKEAVVEEAAVAEKAMVVEEPVLAEELPDAITEKLTAAIASADEQPDSDEGFASSEPLQPDSSPFASSPSEPSPPELVTVETSVASAADELQDVAISEKEDDWGDDLTDALEAEPLKSAPSLEKDKPSLIKTPLVLAGWVKDVVTSMTKPKPSKPMIEIPRREPDRSSVLTRDDAANDSAVEDAPTNDVSANDVSANDDLAFEQGESDDQDFAAVVNSGNDNLDDERWEESNWDD